MVFKPKTPEAREAALIAKDNEALETEEKKFAEAARVATKGTGEVGEDGFKRKLSDDSRAQITARAKELVEQELMKQERDRFMQEEVKRLRLEAGVAAPSAVGGTLDDLVEFTPNLGYEGQAFIQLNQPHGLCYYHGVKYQIPRHIANTLNEICFAGHRLHKHVKGESFFRQRDYVQVISGVKGATAVSRNQLN